MKREEDGDKTRSQIIYQVIHRATVVLALTKLLGDPVRYINVLFYVYL